MQWVAVTVQGVCGSWCQADACATLQFDNSAQCSEVAATVQGACGSWCQADACTTLRVGNFVNSAVVMQGVEYTHAAWRQTADACANLQAAFGHIAIECLVQQKCAAAAGLEGVE